MIAGPSGDSRVESYPPFQGLLAKQGPNSAAPLHEIAEAERLAYAHRAAHLGDPDFAKIASPVSSPRLALSICGRSSRPTAPAPAPTFDMVTITTAKEEAGGPLEAAAVTPDNIPRGRPAASKCNLKANRVQVNPNKTKQISFDLLGFIRRYWT
jgi:hypothetical protein